MSETDQKTPKRMTLTQKIEALRTEFYTHADHLESQIDMVRNLNLGHRLDDTFEFVNKIRRDLDGMKFRNYAALALAGLALLVALVF